MPAALVLLLMTGPARAQTAAEEIQRLARPVPVRDLVPSYAEAQRRRQLEEFQPIGHRVVAPEELAEVSRQSYDPSRRQYTGRRVKTETVELSFLRPALGLTAGVGWSERDERLGSFRSPTDRTRFGFVRFQLSKPRPSRPALFLPEARVTESERTDRDRTSVEEHSIRDLPRP